MMIYHHPASKNLDKIISFMLNKLKQKLTNPLQKNKNKIQKNRLLDIELLENSLKYKKENLVF